jgi:citrate lyase subunit beta/citryl-CoA lyase
MLDKAGRRGADALIVDLEDAVAPANKEPARAATAQWLARDWESPVQRWVRINGGDDGLKDLAALSGLDIDGYVIPKLTRADELDQWTKRIDRTQPNCALIVIIESAGALREIDRIAAHPRTSQLMIGEADLSADTGINPTSSVWDSLRAIVVVASAAAGLPPPIGPVDPDYSSPAELAAATRHLKDLGFGARAIIHPAQVEPVHSAFQPSSREVEEARSLLADYDRALAAGRGVGLDRSGAMFDAAFVRRAHLVVARASRYETPRD